MYYKSLQFLKRAGCLLGLFWLSLSGPLWAQTPDYSYVSNNLRTNSIPLGGSVWASQRNQWVYGVGDFGTVPGGMAITTLYLRQGTISDAACTWTNFEIKLGQPNMTSGFNGTWVTGLTTVLSSASYSMGATSANQWLQFDLDVPFLYDPTKPLVVETYQTATSGRKTLAAGGNNSTMSGNTQQYGQITAGTGNARRYSYSCGIDLISMNIDVTEIDFVPDLCQEEVQTVSVKIKNTDLNSQTGFWVEYSIDGVHQATDVYTGTIQAGDSAWHTFSLPVNSNTAGNFDITSTISGKTPVAPPHNFTVKPAPLGSFVSKGTPFDGSFNSGDALDPDIVAYGDQINYEIDPPTGYNNSGYASTWEFSTWYMETNNGAPAGSSFSTTVPSSGNNAKATFDPVIGQSDSSYLMCYAIESLANGCSAPEICRELFVAPRPISGFSANTACEGLAMQFTNSSTVSSGSIEHHWDFGDGSTSTIINPSHIYTTHGSYDVTLTTTTNYGYADIAVVTVTVNQNPSAEFGYTNVCEGTIMPFSDGSIIPAGMPTYEWNFGDGSAMGSGANPTHQYASPGSYTVTMKVTANGCSDMASRYVTYAPRAVPDFTPSTAVCNNEMVTFTNGTTISSGQVGYNWTFGDNTVSTQKDPNHTYTIFGNIDVTLTVTTGFGCVDQITKQISLVEAPKADFTNSLLCDKDDADFINTSSEPALANTTYVWEFSDGSSYMTKDVTRSFPSVGTYTVTLKAFADNGCFNTINKTISVDEEPVAEFYAEDVCEGTDVNLLNASTGNAGNFTNAWDFGASGSSTVKNPSVTLPVGSTDITLTVTTPSGCSSTLTKPVKVNPIPTSSATVSSGQKGDGTFTYTSTVSPANVNYVIFWGDGGRSTGTAAGGQINEIYTYSVDGNYQVCARLEKNGCSIESCETASVTRTGLLNVSEGMINVYPNPSNGIFNLDLTGLNTTDIRIDVYAADGQLINGHVEMNGEESARLDLSTAAAGVYLVRVSTSSGIHTARITLNK